MTHTLPGVSQIRNRLRHQDRATDAPIRAVHAELHEKVVQHAFHHIPVTDHTGAGVETIAQLSSCRRIDVSIISDELALTVELAITVSAHDGRYGESGVLVERPTGLD